MSLQHTFGELREQLAKRIIGQEKLVDRLLIALLADGHLLVEGAPGLAKTTAIKGRTETSAPQISTAANCEAPANTVVLIRIDCSGVNPS